MTTNYHKKRYGHWGGNPGGYPAIPEQCAKEVNDSFTHRFHQCSRKRGHGPESAFCKQHAKAYQQKDGAA